MGLPLASHWSILLYLKPCNFSWIDSFSSLHIKLLNSPKVRLKSPADQVTRVSESVSFHHLTNEEKEAPPNILK